MISKSTFILTYCPITDECPKNEEYNSCPDNMCVAKKCTDVGFPLNCTTTNPCPGKPGCVCKNGLLRNDKGVCITTINCRKCNSFFYTG